MFLNDFLFFRTSQRISIFNASVFLIIQIILATTSPTSCQADLQPLSHTLNTFLLPRVIMHSTKTTMPPSLLLQWTHLIPNYVFVRSTKWDVQHLLAKKATACLLTVIWTTDLLCTVRGTLVKVQWTHRNNILWRYKRRLLALL
jgi:hypothetical protein